MMRLFGVDMLIPNSKTPQPTATTLIGGARGADQSNALTLWTNPVSSSTSSSGSSRKRKISSERSLVPWTASSSSSSALTILSEERSNPNLGKKARKVRPSKEEVAMATSTYPPLSTLLKFEVIEKLGFHGCFECNPKLIIQKYVFESDIKEDQARLLIPVMQLIEKEERFLKDAEFVKLNKVGVGEIEVKVMYYKHIIEGEGDGDGKVIKGKDMKFSRWPKPTTSEDAKTRSVSYVLQHGWNEVVKDIDLKHEDSIQVWAFRYSNPHPHPRNNLGEDNLALVLVNLGNSRKLKGKSIGN